MSRAINTHEPRTAKMEVSLVSELLIKFYGNKSHVAEHLKLQRTTLNKYLNEYGDIMMMKFGDQWVPLTQLSRRHNEPKVDIQEVIDAINKVRL
ncbi:hypothetical protein SBP1_gp072 [Vibrio virus vB_VspP_SBP1]|uniref:Uncharacterized protein n=1 Tax=Vibrio virus vB_VspP_SBP1 TaxID=2500581 RepID=A0A3T0IIS6_9CAUD|nr:hypothetical protein KNU36_gp057 [Vibrio virus vB_VspP_SBP1]AZU99664.1 hypothetical protein SBP1_gp072 [Vibrio virus vB_VspP_SBP1]